MSKVNRNEPKRSTASESRTSLMEFEQQFPDDATCLDYLVRTLYPNGIFCKKCQKVTKHHRNNGRPSYSCQFCGHHEHPMVGTIFQDSPTSLKLWLYAMYLMASTRCGISAKQLERELGVTYKTAWRMFKLIRTLMAGDTGPLSGTVEMDETFFNRSKRHRPGEPKPKRGAARKGERAVWGAVERGGRVVARHVSTASMVSIDPLVTEFVMPASLVFTDEARHYTGLRNKGYRHRRINHTAKVYVKGDVHTQTIEGFW